MLPEALLEKVVDQAKSLATHSWEYGTLSEALLELSTPTLSVFHPSPFPNNTIPSPSNDDVPALQYARQHILTNGSKTLCGDRTGVADPASLGVSAVLLGQQEEEYLDAACRQAEYLLYEAPRYPEEKDGGGKAQAISHRKDVAELWTDYIYMVPPFLAFYAVAVDDYAIMEVAVQQCTAYHSLLAEKAAGKIKGLWHHIVGPKNADAGYWSTGNGWVAAGLTRVLATLKRWSRTRGEGHEFQRSLRDMIRQLIDAVIVTDVHRQEEELLPNYLYVKDEEPWFGDVAGTALLASVVYRMLCIDQEHFQGKSARDDGVRYIDWAERKSNAVFKCVDPETGIASPAVNSLKHAQREPLMTGNPEAQSFIILLWAAKCDYSKVKAG